MFMMVTQRYARPHRLPRPGQGLAARQVALGLQYQVVLVGYLQNHLEPWDPEFIYSYMKKSYEFIV